MKKVIRGRLYDTTKAKEIGSTYGGGETRSDFHETLYKKRTGEYFLYCCGGEPGEHIKPLSFDEAKEWAEVALDGDEWVTEFGDPEENKNKQVVAISITTGAVDIVKRAAQISGKSVTETIEALIREQLS